ncbi:MAG: response regulator [Paracoccaceae bacterium]|nr:response regulator [Paracoccaceae bacterium]
MTTKPPAIERVMLIDDEMVDQMIYKRVIHRSQLVRDIVTFGYAEDALAYLRDPASPPVDLILLDINMPRMNGFEFLDAYGADPGPGASAVVITMLTTSLTASDRARAEKSELVREFFNKPLTGEHVATAAALVREAKAE